jgi:hypothetical protein
MVTSRRIVIGAMILSSLAGCSEGQSLQYTQDTAMNPTSTSVNIATESGDSIDGNACSDPEGDAAVNDITQVELKPSGSDLLVTWTVSNLALDSGENGFYVMVSSIDGNNAGQLGVKFLNGEQIAHFTFDFSGGNVEVPSRAIITAGSVTADFPMSQLLKYGDDFNWSGTTTRDGRDVDACSTSS